MISDNSRHFVWVGRRFRCASSDTRADCIGGLEWLPKSHHG
jgi:hypothetical protein